MNGIYYAVLCIFPIGVEEVTDADVIAPTLEIRPSIFRDRMKINCNILQSAQNIELKIYNATGRANWNWGQVFWTLGHFNNMLAYRIFRPLRASLSVYK